MARARGQLILLLALLAPALAPAATVEQLVGRPAVTDVRISPDGKYLALKVFVDGEHMLRVVERENPKNTVGFKLALNDEIGEYYWANNERIVGQVLMVAPGKEAPEFYGELFGIDRDGTNGLMLYGVRSGQIDAARAGRPTGDEADRAWAQVMDLLPGDDEHVLIAATPFSRARRLPSEAILLNVHTGRETPLGIKGEAAFTRFFSDRDGTVRVIASPLANGAISLKTLPRGASEWLDIPSSVHGGAPRPLAVAEDGQSFYLIDNLDGDRSGLYRLALDGSSYSRVYVHDRVDITNVVYSTDRRSIYAIRVDDGKPSYIIFTDTEESALFKKLMQYFAGMFVSVVDRSRDEACWVIKTSSDVDPGAFYLYEPGRNNLTLVARLLRDVDPEELAPMAPVSYESFDGQTVHGYFTRAPQRADKRSPLVVLVHGGPQVRDYWGYNSMVQALATNGYSVLQINYRGSRGYGSAFHKAGFRQWGNEVQRDIIAGTRWAIAEGMGSEGEVCIAGDSFGAYSAVQSAILAPDLFKCVIAVSGIYDLPLMYERGDVERTDSGEKYLEAALGRDPIQLARYSPVNNVDALRAPVLIAHGKLDQRAPFKHARNLRKALDKHDKRYEWFVRRESTHGFYSDENRLAFAQAALEFLDKHLKR